MTDFTPWIGRHEIRTDTLSAAHCARVAALFDHTTAPALGDPLPPLWHWCFFTPDAPQAQMGADGHPKLGDFLPPIPQPRRMWAGGRLRFLRPLRVGELVTRETEILSITEKTGRQGALVFVTLRHQLSGAEGLAIEEEQDIVYRSPSTTQRPAPGDPAPAEWRDPVTPDPVMLFRYSALTFNAHRIHYDLPYATGEEGYPALVVHGPLTATLLMAAALRHTGRRPTGFTFRGLAPLFADAPFALCGTQTGDGATLWAEGPGGYTAMSATFTSEAP
ncbi:MAG: MaoC family dehydratase N-terminal domain-containing protein [Rhodobacteraceae bacterium]|nr:MaoC family dehydratase N-terminal domain-containing protein [Paracoccaceae bacterium]